eukprot:ANDGO_01304.mRNA.1 hypothetical protein
MSNDVVFRILIVGVDRDELEDLKLNLQEQTESMMTSQPSGMIAPRLEFQVALEREGFQSATTTTDCILFVIGGRFTEAASAVYESVSRKMRSVPIVCVVAGLDNMLPLEELSLQPADEVARIENRVRADVSQYTSMRFADVVVCCILRGRSAVPFEWYVKDSSRRLLQSLVKLLESRPLAVESTPLLVQTDATCSQLPSAKDSDPDSEREDQARHYCSCVVS